MNLARKAVSGVKWNGVAVGGRAVIQFFTLAILSRLLKPADFGLVGMATVVTGFVYNFEDLGLANSLIHKQDTTREQFSSIFWFNIIFGWSLFGLIWLATPLVVMYYREPAVSQILRWSAASYLILPFSSLFQGLLRRDLRFKERTVTQVANLIAHSIASIILAWLGYGAMSLVWGTLLGTTVAVILTLFLAYQSGWMPLFHFRWADLAGHLKFGLYQSGSRSLTYMSNNVDYFIIGRLLGPEALGYYTLAYNLMRLPLGYVNPLVNTVAFPVFARVQNEFQLLKQGYIRIIKYLSIATVPLMIGMFVVAPLLIPVFYGPQWGNSIPVVRIFAGVGILLSLGNPLESLLLAKGKANLLLYLSAFTIVVYVIGNWIGSYWGIKGVAMSTLLIASLFIFPIQLKLIRRFTGMGPMQMWLTVRSAVVCSIIMAVMIYGLNFILTTILDDLPLLLMLVVTGGMLYGGALYMLDKHTLWQLIDDFGLGRLLPSAVVANRRS